MTHLAPTAAEIDAALALPEAEVRSLMATWAADGHAEAQLALGQMLLDGHGGPIEAERGFHLFVRAARAGHPMASNMVGRCYENGWGVSPSDDLATAWFGRAARAGLDWGMYNFATSLALGRGIEQDHKAARRWLERAVALGHAKSMTVLGGFLEDGWAGPRDLPGALDLYRRGAMAGDFRGAFNVGRLHLEAGDEMTALPYLRTAWRDGNAAFRLKFEAFVSAYGISHVE